MNKWLLTLLTLCIWFSTASAQDSFTVRAQRYIQQYHKYAIAEQRRSGVPASVTLGQGILETEAGRSELACIANNHFGIKCKSDYAGEKFFHDDDAPKECFRMYRCAEESYRDHSDYLKRNPRYAPLFSLSQTDYAGWAVCLKKCGYATNPQYAQRLIKIIEDFKLQEYTYTALDSASEASMLTAYEEKKYDQKNNNGQPHMVLVASAAPGLSLASAPQNQPDPAATPQAQPVAPSGGDTTRPHDSAAVAHLVDSTQQQPVSTTTEPAFKKSDIVFDSGKIMTLNGLKAFMGKKGDMLLQYAVKYNVHYPRLLEYNDIPDGPLPYDMPVYLEKKLASGTHVKHTVKEEENMLLIAQAEGIQLRRLLALNMLDPNEEPAPGAILELQNGASHKPGLRAAPPVDLKTAKNMSYVKPTPAADFVEIQHNKPSTPATQPVKEVVKSDVVTTIALPRDTTSKSGPAVITAITVDSQTKDTAAVAATPEKQEKDELAELKAELDKVVYAEDKKPLPDPQQGKHEPVVITTFGGNDAPAKGSRKPKPASNNDDPKYYTIQKGDNLSVVAKKSGVPVKQLQKLNNVNERSLRPGQKIRLK